MVTKRCFGFLFFVLLCCHLVVDITLANPGLLQIQKINPYDDRSTSNTSSNEENSSTSTTTTSSSQQNNEQLVVVGRTENISNKRGLLVLTKRRRLIAGNSNNRIQEPFQRLKQQQQQSESTSYKIGNDDDVVPKEEVATAAATTAVASSSSVVHDDQQQKRKDRLVVSLLGITGIAEAICFRRFGCFPNMMTGNTVKLMDAIASLDFDSILFYASIIGCYVLGSAIPKFFDAIIASSSINPDSNNSKSASGVKQPSLIQFGRIAFVLFGLSDLVALLTCGRGKSSSLLSSPSTSTSMMSSLSRLSIMAIAFGMINAATLKETGSVTNAVTGHWGKIGGEIGTGAAETMMMLMLLPSSSSSSSKSTVACDKNKSSKGILTSLSLRCVITYMSSLLVTTIIMIWIEGESHNHLSSIQQLLQRFPPLGISLGLLYNVLFGWYFNSKRQQPKMEQ